MEITKKQNFIWFLISIIPSYICILLGFIFVFCHCYEVIFKDTANMEIIIRGVFLIFVGAIYFMFNYLVRKVVFDFEIVKGEEK